jgi:hypothetical protein
MHSLLLGSGLTRRLRHEIPAGLSALTLAELFYKFHSFTLECLAFLATWYAIGWLLSAFLARNQSAIKPPVPVATK